MIIGWIVCRSRTSGVTEFISEDNNWSVKSAECAIFRDKNVAQSHVTINDDFPEELIPVEVQF